MPDVQREIDRLREEIRRHDFSYYVEHAPTISDVEYDRLFKQLQALEDSHPELITADSPTQRVGETPMEGFEHVTHAVPMQSIDNTYDEKQLREFDGRVRKLLGHDDYEYLVDPKIDGVAVSLRYEAGRFAQGATRGDGQVGDDITQNLRTIASIPLKLHGKGFPEILEVRGEVFWPFEDFQKYNATREKAGEPAFANPRNATSGTLKQLDARKVADRGLAFICHGFGLIEPNPFETHSELAEQFKKWGIPVSRHSRLFDDIDGVLTYCHEWDQLRAEMPYLTDGLVIKVDRLDQRVELGSTSRFPRWCIAYKLAAEQGRTILRDVEWQIGKLGTISPVARLEPVELAGTTVSNANLHNPVQIEKLGIRKGDTVIVEKAGEIIPQVVGVVKELRPKDAKKIPIPTECPSCGAETVRDKPDEGLVAFRCENPRCGDAYKVIQRKQARETCHRCDEPVVIVEELPNLRCVNPECPATVKAILTSFASRGAMDIEGLGEATVILLMQQNPPLLRSIADIYHLHEHRETLEHLPGFGKKSVANLLKGIEASKGRSLARLLSAINIPNVGSATGEELANHFGSMDALLDASVDDIYEALSKAGGGDESKSSAKKKTPTAIREYLDRGEVRELIHRLRELGLNMQQEKSTAEPESQAWSGRTVVITGTLTSMGRKDAEALVKRLGGKTASSVSKKTDFVVAGESPGSKLDKAQALGVKVMDEDAFLSAVREAGVEIG